MTRSDHRAEHERLHRALDELLADYLEHHPEARLTQMRFWDLMQWSYEQTLDPTPTPGYEHDPEPA